MQIVPVVVPFLDYLYSGTKYTIKELGLSVAAIFGVYLVLFYGENSANTNVEYVQGLRKIFTLIVLFLFVTIGYAISVIMLRSLRDYNTTMVIYNFNLA